jgi:deoxyribodipyrimidine photo-lyase
LQFLQQCLSDLDEQLSILGQRLIVLTGEPVACLQPLIDTFDINRLARAKHPGTEERNWLAAIGRRNPQLRCLHADSLRLWSTEELPFAINELPPTFSQARRQLESLNIAPPAEAPGSLPPPPGGLNVLPPDLRAAVDTQSLLVKGGSAAAHSHVKAYFNSSAPSVYKETRNTLDTFAHSTNFSPWLASGSISPREIIAALIKYEEAHGANQSTYWIFFELMWREYFHLYAWRHGARLFLQTGHRKSLPYDLQPTARFSDWCSGNTAFPLVNACIHQLNETGYMSNRGRQLVASCLVNEMGLDWRLGANWFERQLIDYDVASNWGNWQYLAGVGADPRGLRRFNQDKQQQLYDPNGTFIKQWHGSHQ